MFPDPPWQECYPCPGHFFHLPFRPIGNDLFREALDWSFFFPAPNGAEECSRGWSEAQPVVEIPIPACPARGKGFLGPIRGRFQFRRTSTGSANSVRSTRGYTPRPHSGSEETPLISSI